MNYLTRDLLDAVTHRPLDNQDAATADAMVARLLHAEGITTCATLWGSTDPSRRPGSATFYRFRTFKAGKADVHIARGRVLTEEDARQIIGRHRHGTTRAQ